MWQTIGQTKIITLAERAIKKGKFAQAYLLVGPKHIGKKTFALDLARALNCHGEKPPCSQCQSCIRINNGNHADTMVLSIDSPDILEEDKERTKIGIKKIQFLQNSTGLPPFEGKFKIFIIDCAEDMSNEAANCLLKILEEPPPKVIIFLLTADESQLLPTVVSRCQRLELTPVPIATIEETLLRYWSESGSGNAKLISRLSKGRLGWALNVAADPAYLEKRIEKMEQAFSLLSSGYSQRLLYISQLQTDRPSTEELIKFWLDWWRDVMLAKCNCQYSMVNIDQMPMLEMWARATTLFEINNFIKNLQMSLVRITLNANPRLIIECLLLDMPIKNLIIDRNVYKSN